MPLHAYGDQPTDQQRLWRYMDFTKYVQLIRCRQLWLARSDTFADPWEGLAIRGVVGPVRSGNAGPNVADVEALSAELSPPDRNRVYANCWCALDHESAALWDLYLQSTEGVCVVTNAAALRGEMASSRLDLEGGYVRYLDVRGHTAPLEDPLERAFTKDISFSHEREFRVAWLRPLSEGGAPPPGVAIDVNVRSLIQETLVHPLAPDWFLKLVQEITAEGASAGVEVRASFLGKPFRSFHLSVREEVHADDSVTLERVDPYRPDEPDPPGVYPDEEEPVA